MRLPWNFPHLKTQEAPVHTFGNLPYGPSRVTLRLDPGGPHSGQPEVLSGQVAQQGPGRAVRRTQVTGAAAHGGARWGETRGKRGAGGRCGPEARACAVPVGDAPVSSTHDSAPVHRPREGARAGSRAAPPGAPRLLSRRRPRAPPVCPRSLGGGAGACRVRGHVRTAAT